MVQGRLFLRPVPPVPGREDMPRTLIMGVVVGEQLVLDPDVEEMIEVEVELRVRRRFRDTMRQFIEHSHGSVLMEYNDEQRYGQVCEADGKVLTERKPRQRGSLKKQA